MSAWVPVLGYDFAVIEGRPVGRTVVLIRGGDYASGPPENAPWRVHCTTYDLDAARRIAGLLNAALKEQGES